MSSGAAGPSPPTSQGRRPPAGPRRSRRAGRTSRRSRAGSPRSSRPAHGPEHPDDEADTGRKQRQARQTSSQWLRGPDGAAGFHVAILLSGGWRTDQTASRAGFKSAFNSWGSGKDTSSFTVSNSSTVRTPSFAGEAHDLLDQDLGSRSAGRQAEDPDALEPLGPDVARPLDEVRRDAVGPGDLAHPQGVGVNWALPGRAACRRAAPSPSRRPGGSGSRSRCPAWTAP